jgi:predicted aspartyl protease
MMFEVYSFATTANPIIPIKLLEAEQPRSALVDTGASYCVLPYKVGLELELPPRNDADTIEQLRGVDCVQRELVVGIIGEEQTHPMVIPFMWAQEHEHVTWDLILLGTQGFLEEVHLWYWYPKFFVLFDDAGLPELRRAMMILAQ